MAKHTTTVSIKAANTIEAGAKAKSLEAIGSIFSAQDLANMVKLLTHPVKGIIAKTQLIRTVNEHI